MLNKEHLFYHRVKGVCRPDFVDAAAPELRELAERLLALYGEAARSSLTRGELEELTESAVRGASAPKIAAGLNKLLMDRAEFSPAQEQDYPALRARLFAAGSEALRRAAGDETAYRTILEKTEGLGDFVRSDIYGDLPDFEHLLRFDALTAEELLQRYNLAQAQGLLMMSRELTVTVRDAEVQELRRLLKYMKFFRLLAEIRQQGEGTLELRISGPLSLFGPTRKYALQLAEFLPAVVRLPHYRVEAELSLPRGDGKLLLEDSMPLVSHYRNFSAYLPEEIRLYHRHFAATVREWTIVGEAPFLHVPGGEIIFPDLSFRNEAGVVCHLELFHRWHGGRLRPRLEYLEHTPGVPLLLGVDRSLAPDDGAWEELQREFPAAMEHCWRFRDFPGVETTVHKLNAFAERMQGR